MIHLYEIIAFALCFAVVIFLHKKVAAQLGNKPIAILSTVIATISILTLFTAYSWFSYSNNINWDFISTDWQEVNSKGWNDVNYIKDEIGQVIMVVAAVTNPILTPLVFALVIGVAMSNGMGVPEQSSILFFFVLPALFSLIIYIGLTNIFAKVVRWLYRKIRIKT